MPAYVVAQMEVHDIETYREYAMKVMETTGSHEAKLLVANEGDVLEGDLSLRRTVIAEFPSADEARAWYESEAYQAIAPLRRQSTASTVFIAEGFSMPEATTN